MDAEAITLFNELADRSPSEREEYYARHQVSQALRAEVESLVRFDAHDGDSLHEYVAAAAASVAPAHALPPGARLGPYEVIAPAGAGGMGEVYKAKDTRLDRIVAVKILPAHVATDPALNQRFEREARMLAALSHPHICPVFQPRHLAARPVAGHHVAPDDTSSSGCVPGLVCQRRTHRVCLFAR
jgi:hypothetical protein